MQRTEHLEHLISEPECVARPGEIAVPIAVTEDEGESRGAVPTLARILLHHPSEPVMLVLRETVRDGYDPGLVHPAAALPQPWHQHPAVLHRGFLCEHDRIADIPYERDQDVGGVVTVGSRQVLYPQGG